MKNHRSEKSFKKFGILQKGMGYIIPKNVINKTGDDVDDDLRSGGIINKMLNIKNNALLDGNFNDVFFCDINKEEWNGFLSQFKYENHGLNKDAMITLRISLVIKIYGKIFLIRFY